MSLSDLFAKREIGDELPRQTSDEELLAWAKALRKNAPTTDVARPPRRKPLIAEPLAPQSHRPEPPAGYMNRPRPS